MDVINDETLESYRSKSFKYIKFAHLDTTMAFWFLLNSIQDWEDFFESIEHWKTEYSENYIIGIQDKLNIVQYNSYDEFDDFEIIG